MPLSIFLTHVFNRVSHPFTSSEKIYQTAKLKSETIPASIKLLEQRKRVFTRISEKQNMSREFRDESVNLIKFISKLKKIQFKENEYISRFIATTLTPVSFTDVHAEPPSQ